MDTAADAVADHALAGELAAGLERVVRLLRGLSSPGDLSLTAVATLATLERSGPCRLTWLASREGVSQPGMTQLVSRLQSAGLVVRDADSADRRAVNVRITDAGSALLARRRSTRADHLAGMLARLNPSDRAALAAALPALGTLARLEPGERGPSDSRHSEPHRAMAPSAGDA